MNRTRKEKIEYLSNVLLLTQDKDQCDFFEEARIALDEIFPPLAPIEYDKSYERHYIPFSLTYEVQTKGKGSTFRIAAEDDRMAIGGSSFEHEFLQVMAKQIREEYGE